MGAVAAQRFAEVLEREAGVSLVIRNDKAAQQRRHECGGKEEDGAGGRRLARGNGEVLNFLCGAEHVQKKKSLPRNFGKPGTREAKKTERVQPICRAGAAFFLEVDEAKLDLPENLPLHWAL